MVGAWNKLLVVAGSLFPGLGNNYAALGAWDTQLTDLPISPRRKANLHLPVDTTEDHGAHGIFDDRAGGLFDPSFLRSLPDVARTFWTAWGRTARGEGPKVLAGPGAQGGGCPMKLPHFTQHGTRTSGDALDLFVEETALLRQLFAKWNTTTPDRIDGRQRRHRQVGPRHRGQAAPRACRGSPRRRRGHRPRAPRPRSDPDVLRLTRGRRTTACARFSTRCTTASRGVQPISVAITPDFIEAVEQLQELLRPELGGAAESQVESS